MRIASSDRARHFFVRAHAGEPLPDALLELVRLHEIRAGWASGHGVLADVELRTIDGGDVSATRRIAGPVRAAVIDVAFGTSQGEPSIGVRVVLSWESETGLATASGDLIAARVVGLEAMITALDDLTLERAIDRDARAWLWSVDVGRAEASAPAPDKRAKAAPSGWGEAIAASAEREGSRPTAMTRTHSTAASTTPPVRPLAAREEDDAPYPEAGDAVEHFAFGRCEVLKSDGDRLHLKVQKDGRIREIALAMLRVTELESTDPKRRRFKLDRKA